MNPEDEAEEDGANIDLDSQRKGKCVVLKTSTRQVKNLIISLLLESKLCFYIKISICFWCSNIDETDFYLYGKPLV